jgi:protein phosphatase
MSGTPGAPLRLPPGALVLLVGVAGSGKSTFAARHFAPGEVLSSDAYRGLVAGDEADQSATDEAFRRLHADLARRLTAGALTVVDATNVQPWARHTLLAEARRAGRPSIAIVLDLPLDLCRARARDRLARPIPGRVVRWQHRTLHAGLASLPAEGYAEVRILREPPEVDAARIVRADDQRAVVEQTATSPT